MNCAEIDDDYAGVVMMSFPTNYNLPEPLRIWPENQNGSGDMFANFCPAKDIDWMLVPGQNYVLKYRLIESSMVDFVVFLVSSHNLRLT